MRPVKWSIRPMKGNIWSVNGNTRSAKKSVWPLKGSIIRSMKRVNGGIRPRKGGNFTRSILHLSRLLLSTESISEIPLFARLLLPFTVRIPLSKAVCTLTQGRICPFISHTLLSTYRVGYPPKIIYNAQGCAVCLVLSPSTHQLMVWIMLITSQWSIFQTVKNHVCCGATKPWNQDWLNWAEEALTFLTNSDLLKNKNNSFFEVSV